MNINQGLRRAKVLKGKIAEWENRSRQSNVVSEGETKPTFQFDECVEARTKAQDELLKIESAIAIENAKTTIKFGKGDDEKKITLCEAIRRLSVIKGTIAWYQRMPTLTQKEEVATRNKQVWNKKERMHDYVEEEYKKTCTISAKEIAGKIDALQETFDDLNGVVEGANHSTNLSGLA
jgi:hypothetical protein